METVCSDDGETLKSGSRQDPETHMCLLPQIALPPAVSQAPRQPLMSSAGKTLRQISTQAREQEAWLSPGKCFQLVLGNWCQLLWGELLGTSWAVGRWALDWSRSLAGEPVLPPRGPGGLEAELLGDGFHLVEGSSCWMKARTTQGSIH